MQMRTELEEQFRKAYKRRNGSTKNATKAWKRHQGTSLMKSLKKVTKSTKSKWKASLSDENKQIMFNAYSDGGEPPSDVNK
jgi:uncharacterized lipoprotein YddW (UPF0748 family)